MEHDRRYEFACRLGLLAGAGIHWAGAALLLMGDLNTTSTLRSTSRVIRAIASSVVQVLVGA